MRSPFARATGAAILLAVYYWVLATHPFAPPMAAADRQLEDDIRASRALFEAGKFAEALPPTERLATQLSSQAVYHARHARILHALQRPEAEAGAWERVMTTSPTPVDACPMVAEAYQRAGDADRAIAAFERCATLPPIDPDFLLALGQALAGAGRPAEARRAFERGLAVAPEYPDLHLLLGIRRFSDGDRPGARQSFETFARLAPSRLAEVESWLTRTRGRP